MSRPNEPAADAGIFISYRRAVSRKDARALFERLRREFAGRRVFMDVADMEPGIDFHEAITGHVAACGVLLALIGAGWHAVTDPRGRRRLALPDDFVRLEIASALARPGVRVVPVLLDDAELPDVAELPDDLKPLLRRHALRLRDDSFDTDVLRLVDSLHRLFGSTAPAPAAQPASPQPAPGVSPAFRPAWADAADRDRHGAWADLKVGSVVQRMRWIAPGSFTMGAPKSEAGRYSDEGPQHRVTLTRGFWLADTPCTQALWRAVVGDNPSEFKETADAAERPVEQVSWDDVVEKFLPALARRLPAGCDAALPTEAEWEYACRAGTATAYHWGDEWDAGNANVQSNGTTPVKRYAPNGWGLYDMHGNVWEWCGDLGQREYRAQAEEDPRVRQEQGIRPRRGGAWGAVAARARAAARILDRRDFGWNDFGFRFALRSPGPEGPGRA